MRNNDKQKTLNSKFFFLNALMISASILMTVVCGILAKAGWETAITIFMCYCIPIVLDLLGIALSHKIKNKNTTLQTARAVELLSIILSAGILLIMMLLGSICFFLYTYGVFYAIYFMLIFFIILSEHKTIETRERVNVWPRQASKKQDITLQAGSHLTHNGFDNSCGVLKQDSHTAFNALRAERGGFEANSILKNMDKHIMQEQALKNIETNYMSHRSFLNNWIVDSYFQKGLKYEDCSGCYVILIFDNEVTDDDYSDYKDVYVGQSKRVHSRVYSHFKGKGNGDVYCDVRNGKYVYVKFYKCDETRMNYLEKQLIARHDATKSYNKTCGGSGKK